jgi:ketosteroid isomerase-like protein
MDRRFLERVGQSAEPKGDEKMDDTRPLDPRLQALLDKEEIRELTYRFARGVDRHDWDLVRSCYHDDANDFHGVFDGAVADYVAWMSENLPKIAERTTHHVSNGLIELHGDVAFCESYVFASHRYARDGAKADCLCGARYVDRLERREGVWRIVTRQLVWEWVRDDAVAVEFEGFGIDPDLCRWGEHGRGDAAYTLGRAAAHP